jgi:hypothetical protein
MMHTFYALAILLLGKWNVNPYSLSRRLGGSQNWSGGFGREKNLLLLLGIEP